MGLVYCVLASGSGGNCVWVRGGGVELLVDCGLSARRIGQRLADVGGDLGNVSAVVCTHSHGDHIAGASVLARRRGVNIYGTRPTLNRIPGAPPAERLHAIAPGGSVTIGGLTVHTCPTRHDAPGSMAVLITDGETSMALATDLGKPTRGIDRLLREADGVVLATNHDLELLRDGPYPAALKRRIRSDQGHLSNEQAADLLAQIIHPRLRHLTLAHLSETNNTPAHAARAIEPVLSRAGCAPTLAIADQHEPGEPVVLAARPNGMPVATVRSQLELPLLE
jgi:phosphoribosyl 1,2-cyclic phosphodiesterase